jgi:alditol oxidase
MMKEYTEICEPTYFGGSLVKKTHPVPGRSDAPCVDSGFGMWNDKIYHFKPDLPPSSAGDEIQSEFFVKYKDLPTAVEDLY